MVWHKSHFFVTPHTMKYISSVATAALAVLHGTHFIDAFPTPSHFQLRNAVKSEQASKNGVIQRTFATRQCNSRSQLFATSPAYSDNVYASPQLDTDAIIKYAVAGITEMSLFGLTFQLADLALSRIQLTASQLPFPLLAFVFYATSLKSRVFNPLNNQRPDRSKAIDGKGSVGFRDRVMPKWTPPGFIFPIMWLLIIGPIRAFSSASVIQTTGTFFSMPTMAFILHLTVGDIWNTINNTEKRYGAAVMGVLAVVASAANAANQYYTVKPLAGKLLGATCVWLVTAAALITDTWRLNPVLVEGEKRKVPLYPVRGEAKTSFMWFAKAENSGDSGESANPSGPGCIRKVDDENNGEEKVTYRNQAHLRKALLSEDK
jgi:tryptophan-rich sensory protein